MYYIDDTLGLLESNKSERLLLLMINELLRSKYSNIMFYAHNLGGYDAIFILSILYKYNDSVLDKKNKYIISTIFRDDKVIKLTIKKDKNTLNIMDSYCVLTNSLEKLGEDFDVPTLKSKFPYTFVKENTLFYKGNTPNIEYYNDITQDDYDKMYKEY